MKKYKYDFLLVGAGLFNAIFAREATKYDKKCLVIDKRNHIGGNLFCENIEGINVHKYGAHIFHTNDKFIWKYMSELCDFNHYINSPLANYKDEIYNLPFNMNTFNRLWNLNSPQEVKMKIESQLLRISSPSNLKEQALSLVGKDIYEKLIKEYTEKQWGKECRLLPASIIKRIPIRFTYDNNYFDAVYQGIPKGGYNSIFEKCFEGCDIILNTDFLANRQIAKSARKTVFTGMIDQYYDYCFGTLEYRSLHFAHELLDSDNFQGNAVVNYTDSETPYTRIIEHKHFEFGKQAHTVITKEYPLKWEKELEAYYPVNTQDNENIYIKYLDLAKQENGVYFAGRLGSYKYYDMDQTVKSALQLFNEINSNNLLLFKN